MAQEALSVQPPLQREPSQQELEVARNLIEHSQRIATVQQPQQPQFVAHNQSQQQQEQQYQRMEGEVSPSGAARRGSQEDGEQRSVHHDLGDTELQQQQQGSPFAAPPQEAYQNGHRQMLQPPQQPQQQRRPPAGPGQTCRYVYQPSGCRRRRKSMAFIHSRRLTRLQ